MDFSSPWLTHWGRVTHICASKLTCIGSDNGLSPGRRQTIIRINAGILLFWPLETHFSDKLVEIHIFLFQKLHSKMSSAKRRPYCLSLNVSKWLSDYHVGALVTYRTYKTRFSPQRADQQQYNTAQNLMSNVTRLPVLFLFTRHSHYPYPKYRRFSVNIGSTLIDQGTKSSWRRESNAPDSQ